jgi:2-keto-4-pentenoate hydratase/2-oxohepta-3-ene-1,7-dioic acid hydratase in catechol pathway
VPTSMRWVSYELDGAVYAGVVDGAGVKAAGEGGVGELLRSGSLPAEPPSGPVLSPSSLTLLPPVHNPGKIICLGLNYRQHAEEAGLEAPAVPTFFAKWANALAPPGADVALPSYSDKVDYEAEVAFVIGRRCKDVAEADALDVVAGYTLLNDLSARDYQFKTPQWGPGKVFDGSAPCGPSLVTPDEAGPPDALSISLTLNGELMQSASTADLIHSIPSVVAYLSELMTLEPGDLVSTGTPAGVGSVRQPRVWLRAGDEVVVESPQLGRLETRLT